jgi:hypothetical protein
MPGMVTLGGANHAGATPLANHRSPLPRAPCTAAERRWTSFWKPAVSSGQPPLHRPHRLLACPRERPMTQSQNPHMLARPRPRPPLASRESSAAQPPTHARCMDGREGETSGPEWPDQTCAWPATQLQAWLWLSERRQQAQLAAAGTLGQSRHLQRRSHGGGPGDGGGAHAPAASGVSRAPFTASRHHRAN